MSSTGHSHVTFTSQKVGIHKKICAGLRCGTEKPIGVFYQTFGLIPPPPLKILFRRAIFSGLSASSHKFAHSLRFSFLINKKPLLQLRREKTFLHCDSCRNEKKRLSPPPLASPPLCSTRWPCEAMLDMAELGVICSAPL